MALYTCSSHAEGHLVHAAKFDDGDDCDNDDDDDDDDDDPVKR